MPFQFDKTSGITREYSTTLPTGVEGTGNVTASVGALAAKSALYKGRDIPRPVTFSDYKD